MKLLGLSLVLALLAACGNDDHGRGVIANAPSSMEPPPAAAPPPPTTRAAPTAATPAAAAAPVPDPTTPEEIDRARNQAMIDGRDKDVLHFCDLEKVDTKTDAKSQQAMLGCTLSACRIKDEDNAHRYGKGLQKAYGDQARRVCALQSIAL